MKKITLSNKYIFVLTFLLILLLSLDVKAQTEMITVINGGSTSANGRAPQGSRMITRSIYYISAAEIAASGLVSGNIINTIGFTYGESLSVPPPASQEIPTTGNIKLYLQNTTDLSNLKGTTWNTSAMTLVSDGSFTIPNVFGNVNHTFTGGSQFILGTGGLYIAFDYQNLSNPVSVNNNNAICNTTMISPSIYSAMTTTATAPTTLSSSNFRPVTRLGRIADCLKPNTLGVNFAATTSTSATVTWNPTVISNVDIKYGAFGFNPSSAGTEMTNVSSPYVISGLTGSSVYDFYVRSNCSTTTSEWAGPFSFSTLFSTVNTPYSTSFEHENLNFIGWSNPSRTLINGDWYTAKTAAPSTILHDGEYYAASVTPSATNADNWMFSRGVNLIAGKTYKITYYIRNYNTIGGTRLADYDVKVGKSATIASQTVSLFSQTGLGDETFVLKSHDFTPITSDVYHISFVNKSLANATGTHAIIVDSFKIEDKATLSVSKFEPSMISIYPNPANDVVTIANNQNILLDSVELSDVNGRIIRTIKYDNVSEAKINVADLSSGIYLLNINSSKGKTTKKFVKN